jgi:hypothetical protein
VPHFAVFAGEDHLKLRIWLSAVVLSVAVGPPALGAFEDENILAGMPDGYKVGAQQDNGRTTLMEFIPEGETVQDWTTMITVIVQRDNDDANAADFASNMAAAWGESCAGAKAGLLVDDITNGYPYVIWQYECPLNGQTGKPETMMMKVIPGRDALYMVQYAVRAAPSIKFMKDALDYLGPEVSVCDTRIPERDCPEGM